MGQHIARRLPTFECARDLPLRVLACDFDHTIGRRIARHRARSRRRDHDARTSSKDVRGVVMEMTVQHQFDLMTPQQRREFGGIGQPFARWRLLGQRRVMQHHASKAANRLREQGIEPTVIEYLKVGWTKVQLANIRARSGVTAAALLRVNGTDAADLGLTAPGVADEVLIDAMIKQPILVNRPIVVGPRGVALCRPPERALDLI